MTDKSNKKYPRPTGYCRLPWCDQEVGEIRRYCADHVPRDWEYDEDRLLHKYPWHVFATVGDDQPLYFIGMWKSSNESFRQKADYHGLPDPEHDDRPLIVFSVHDGNSMTDDRMIYAMQYAFDNNIIHERGGDLLMPKTKGKGNKGGSKSGGPSLCLCGCGDMTGGGRFLPGHDAKLKGALIGAVREARKSGDKASEKKATDRMVELNWGHFVPDAEKDAERAKKKAARVAELKKAKKAKEGGKAKAKPKAKAAK